VSVATVAVGDLHGNVRALDDVLAAVLPELGPGDELVFLGDYLDGWPWVPQCIDRILDLQASGPCPVVALMGNHEQWMLKSHRDPTAHSWVLGMGGLETVECYSPEAAAAIADEIRAAGRQAVVGSVPVGYGRFFEALPPAHLAFFLALRAFHHSPDVMCVHGGHPGGKVDGLPDDVFIWGPRNFPDRYDDDQIVVYGHRNNPVVDETGWPYPRVTRDRAFGIDTIRHGVLTAMRFPDLKIFQSRRY
jgi:serine/threonine protein phosphatase 1